MAETKVDRNEYRAPVGAFLRRGSHTSKLYKLEEKRNAAIREAALELQKVLGLEDYWREVMPEELLNILESYDKKAAILAAEKFLARAKVL